MKKVLLVGNSVSAYVIAKILSKKNTVYIAPLNTKKEFAESVDIREDKPSELLEFVLENGIDLTVVLSEKAVKSGITELFTNNNQQIFGALSKTGRIFYDKAFCKKLFYKLRIPTPKFGIFEKQAMALEYLKGQKVPFVLKTDNTNSATVYTNVQNAKNYIEKCFIEKNQKIIIEDYVYGSSFSFYAITDGYKALPLGSSLTYRHSLEGGRGQLTSGMGACSPNYKLSLNNEYFIMDNIIYPTIEYLEAEKTPYMGIIGVNGIITDDEKVYALNYQNFTQDCDSQAVFNNVDEDLYDLFMSCSVGSFSDEIEEIKLNDRYSVTVVLNCNNKNNKENVISGLDNLYETTQINYYPQVLKNKYLEYEAQNGPVISITCSAASVSKASSAVYGEIEEIDFAGKHYRKDICR